MLASILIGLDIPAHCSAFLDPAIRWARPSGATLVGLGIIDEPGVRAIEPARPVGGKPDTSPVYYEGYDHRLAQLDREAAQLLSHFAARCGEAGVAHREVKVVGSPAQVIERQSQSCDLTVLARGSRFRFTTHDDERDDTIRRVLKNAPRPVVVVPPTNCPEGPVVIAYDGSLPAARALAAFEATELGKVGQVHVVCVNTSATEARGHAELARQFLHYHNVDATVFALETSAEPASVILEQISRLKAGLLVMGAYGQSTLREFFIGSVTRTILEKSPVPTFLFH
jgi:nucleotide-binding universal stress UspA family protein